MIKYSKDGKVKFDSEWHTYHMGEKKLQGVTSYISKYKNPFDSETIATDYAKKHGLRKEDVLFMWAEKSRISIENGTAVHNVFENFVLTGKLECTGNYAKEKIAEKFIKDMFYTGRLEPVECETIVYNDTLASQVDCVVRNPKGEHFILDWKTNSSIDYCSFKYQKMLGPYSDYMDCSFYHYSLQLSIYQKLYKDVEICGAFIVHLHETDYQIIKPEQIKLAI